jgi:hypothetical protein
MADNFNIKQFLVENQTGPYVKAKVEEVKRYQIGDMWSPNFDYKGMLKAGAALTSNADVNVMQAISDSFEDVNYHRENSHLQDAIEAKKAGKTDEVIYHLGDFKNELKKTISQIKETQIFEREKVEEGEAAYEYEKGKAAGEKEEKEKLQKEDLADAEAEKMMDFLAEYEVIYVVENGICYRKDDEGNLDRVDMYYCKRYAGTGVREEKEKVKEALSPEAFERMSGLVKTRSVQQMIMAAEDMMNDLTADGFEVEEVREFFTQLIANDI